MVFWVVSLGIAAVAAFFLARALLKGGGAEEAARFDVQVYRDQLGEVDRDLARGVVTESEADAIRTEVSRRLLDADKAAGGGAAASRAPRTLTTLAAVAIGLVTVAGAGALYLDIGAPRYPDMPLKKRIALTEEFRQNRIGQAEAEASAAASLPPTPDTLDPGYLELVEKLRTTVAERPDDLQGHVLLVREEARLGNYPAAHEAQARVVEIKGTEATAQDYVELAELMVIAANGYVSPEAEDAIRAALARDPGYPPARYYSGLLATQIGRYDVAFRIWRGLLESGPADAPWVEPVRAQIGDLARLAGVDYTPPSAGRGPSSADVAAASEMTPEERQEMIRGMVANLSDRLASEGGPPEDWAKLIRAYGVLGETDQAAAIWGEAQQVFPDEAALGPIREAAQAAGVVQ